MFFYLFSIFLLVLICLTAVSELWPSCSDLETEVKRRVIHDAVLKETGDKAFEVCCISALSVMHLSKFYSSLVCRDTSRKTLLIVSF